jgi:hypothetical protein
LPIFRCHSGSAGADYQDAVARLSPPRQPSSPIARHLLVGNAEFFWAGFWFALLLLIGLLAAVTVWSSRMVLVASLVLMGVGCAGFSIVDQILGDFTTLTLAVSNTCFLCSHLRLSGYVMRRIPRAAVLQNRSLWGQLSARHVGDEDADVRP